MPKGIKGFVKGHKHSEEHRGNLSKALKGRKVWNKGISCAEETKVKLSNVSKGKHYSFRTEFQKGVSLRLGMGEPVGTRKIRTAGRHKRVYIKVENPDVWMPYHRFVWVQSNGVIPDGFVIHHLDGDTLNDDISNLVSMRSGDHTVLHNKKRII